MKILKGFSLIELLVVIGIIAILISLSAFGLQQARESARDGQRKGDLETIRTALSMYRADCNKYPVNSGDNVTNALGTTFSSSCAGGANTYLQKTPSDPLSEKFYYYKSDDGNTYVLCAYLETGGTNTATGCPSSGCGLVCNYAVYNP